MDSIAQSGIYAIRNTVNEKKYVGRSKDIERRWAQHRNGLNRGIHHTMRLQYSWRKHGEAAFVFEIIELCPEENLIEREQYWLDFYGVCNPEKGYNFIEKAQGGATTLSEETKQKIREARARQIFTPEIYAKIGLSRRGKPLSFETRQKMSESRKALHWRPSIEHIEKVRQSCLGKTRSDATKYLHYTKVTTASVDDLLNVLKALEDPKRSYADIAREFGVNPKFVSGVDQKGMWWVEEHVRLNNLEYFRPGISQRKIEEMTEESNDKRSKSKRPSDEDTRKILDLLLESYTPSAIRRITGLSDWLVESFESLKYAWMRDFYAANYGDCEILFEAVAGERKQYKQYPGRVLPTRKQGEWRLSGEQISSIKEYIEQGLNNSEIGRLAGCSNATVKNIRNKVPPFDK